LSRIDRVIYGPQSLTKE